MATHLRVPGPALIALGPSGGTMSFFGYTERGADITEEQLELPAMADYSGPRSPADMMLAGKVLTITLPMTDFDSAVMNTALGRYNGGTPGAVAANEIGTLIIAESKGLRLMVKASRQATVSAYANDIAGINVPVGFFRGPARLPISTAPQVVNLVFYTWSAINKSNLSATLWNQDMSGFPSLT